MGAGGLGIYTHRRLTVDHTWPGLHRISQPQETEQVQVTPMLIRGSAVFGPPNLRDFTKIEH